MELEPAADLELQDVTVMDVWNEAPAPGVAFLLLGHVDQADAERMEAIRDGADDRWRVRSDGAGRLRLPTEATQMGLEACTPGWTFVAREEVGPRATPTVWVHATVEIRGRIAIDAPAGGVRSLDMEHVRLSARGLAADEFPGIGESSGEVTIDEAWLVRHRLARFDDVARPDASGRFICTVPRVRGLVIVARASAVSPATLPAWRPASVGIRDSDAGARQADVELVLRAGYVISGTLEDELGNPVRFATCRLHVVRSLTEAECKPSELLSHGHGFTVVGNAKTGVYSVDFQIEVRSDESGRFEFVANVEGDATMFVEPSSEHQVAFVELGPVEQFDRASPILIRSDRDHESVRLLDQHGQPLAGRNVLFHDATNRSVQVALRRTLSERGEVPSRMLIRGREYTIEVRGQDWRPPAVATMRIVWNGERELRFPQSDAH